LFTRFFFPSQDSVNNDFDILENSDEDEGNKVATANGDPR
jgi:hypothetical protein